MSGSSKIEWTQATWNPLTGCTLVSEGCRNCYAARETAGRLSHLPQYQGLAKRVGGRPVFTGEVRLHEDRLDQPLRWHRPRRVFVNSMSDLFHESVPFEFIDRVFAVMAISYRHTFQILSKRPERMAEYLNHEATPGLIEDVISRSYEHDDWVWQPSVAGWPLRNVWLGTSVENQETADQRIPHLLATPAAVRFRSCEPLLGPVSLRGTYADYLDPAGGWWTEPEHDPGCDGSCRNCPVPVQVGGENRIHWVIVGSESGPRRRECDLEWVRSIRDECSTAGVPLFLKQLHLDGRKVGTPTLDGQQWTEMPS